MSNGNCNNINLGLTLSRNNIDNPIYPRKGSDITMSVTLTPPYSLFSKKDYANLATNSNSATYNKEMQEKYSWIEYHKWKFKSRTYTALSGAQKCFVLSTRVEFGILGHYNKHKRSPFETFYVGGDGTSGYSTTYATETIGMRGYEDDVLSPNVNGTVIGASIYQKFTAELRYPITLNPSATVYLLAFVEAGKGWIDKRQYNPFQMHKSVGLGVRVYLPMFGLLGFDYGYGFDPVPGISNWRKQFHISINQSID
jgi:outer membrane protein insertion porin family